MAAEPQDQELARREAARATATGKKVPLGKTGEVIGEIGDEARTAGRHSGLA